jgi:TolB-like protein
MAAMSSASGSSPQPAVFLSYAREDAAETRRLAEALRAAGAEVWFDENELRGGDAWDRAIRKQIRDCALLVPVISANTQARAEGYFRLEWHLAEQRSLLIAKGRPFIVPVCIDTTREADALVPDAFLAVQWSRTNSEAKLAQFIAQVQRLLAPNATVVPASGVSPGKNLPPLTASQPGQRFARWPLAVAVVSVALVGAGLWWRNHGAVPVTPVAQLPPTMAGTASPAPPATLDRSIAVLPFENLSEDKESAYLANGLYGEILHGLTQIAQLRVIPRATVEQYRVAKKPLAQIAAELGVAYLLEGTVRRDQGRVVLAGRLFRAAGAQWVWDEKFQRALSDVFALQAELSRAVATKLQAVMAPQELAALAQSPTKSTEAYQLLLKSQDLWDQQFLNSSGKEQQDLLEQAVKLDPDFTRAWQDLAETCMTRYFMGKERSPAQSDRVRTAIDQCMRLAPDAARTLGVVGFYYYQIRGEYTKALEYMERAVKLEPNVPGHHLALSLVLRRQGKWIESTAKVRQAVQLDPNDIDSLRYLAMNMNYTRRFAEVIEINRRIEVLRPDLPKDPWGTATATYFLNGATDEMALLIAAMTPAERDSPNGLRQQQDLALCKGDFAEFIRLDGLLWPSERRGREGSPYLVTIVQVLAANGDVAAARARLGDRSREQREGLGKGGIDGAGAGGGWARLAQMEALLGRREEALSAAAKAAEVFPEANDALWGPPVSLRIASARAWLGGKEDKDFAIAELRRLLRGALEFDGNVFALKNGAAFFPLRGDPRFEAIVQDPKNKAPLF